jgi:hypothetical protein
MFRNGILGIVLLCSIGSAQDIQPRVEAKKPQTFGVIQDKRRIEALEAQLAEAKAEIESLRNATVDESKTLANGLREFDISGLNALQAEKRPVQWVIETSPACGPCHQFVDAAKAKLPKRLGWDVSDSDTAQFQIVSLTKKEWEESGLTLPRARLFVYGEVVDTRIPNGNMVYEMANMLNDRFKALPASAQQAYGLQLTSVNAKPQVEALFNALVPFLDGGTLQCIYKPRDGVVKEYLTIKQGSAAVMIPAKTSFVLSATKEKIGITFDEPAVRLGIGFLKRDITAIELTPKKLSLRLPWMIDPEIGITGNNSYHDHNGGGVYGSTPRSPHWPTVRKQHLELHPTCAACGTKEHLEVHHKIPFHDDPSKELDPTNLITFCREHHFEIGHDPDGIHNPLKPDWRSDGNPYVEKEAKEVFDKLNPGKAQ